MRMHADEVEVSVAVVRRLVDAQFPQWAGLDLRVVASSGTDNAMFRLGEAMVVRLPRIHWAVEAVAREQAWLGAIGGHARVQVPRPLALGQPGGGYPWAWSVYDWLDGEPAREGQVEHPEQLAGEIADFLMDLQGMPWQGAPAAGRSLGEMDGQLRAAVVAAAGMVDSVAVLRVWDDARALGEWVGAPVWLHGDLAPGNLLLQGGRLTGVIDFSHVGVGDPSVDCCVAWNVLPPAARGVFLRRMGADRETVLRARARALAQAMFQVRYYELSNPVLAAQARHVIGEVLVEAADASGGDI